MFSQSQSFAFKNFDTTLVSRSFLLRASLKIPQGKTNLPCVIFLNGSGPADKDGTVGPNKIALDILNGLAANGIASISFDKRTVQHANQIVKNYDSFTVQNEYVEDALSAIEFVKNIKVIDKKRVFLIGHSEGAIIAPYIYAQAKKSIKAIVLLAASPRNFEDLILSQFQYLLSLDSNNQMIQKQYSMIQHSAQNLPKVYEGKYVPKDSLPFGLPSKYWQSLKETSITKYLPLVKCPILILQGKRDYQVTTNDFENLLLITTKQQKVESAILDSLNHLFMPGTGKSTPLEYSIPSHVSPKVIEKVTAFIREN